MHGTASKGGNKLADTFLESLHEIGTLVSFERHDALCREGDRSCHVLLLASGFVVAVKRLASGKQQNVAFYFPGDIVGHESFTLDFSRCDAIAMIPTTAYKVPHTKLRKLIDSDVAHHFSFWHYIAFQGALGQDWLLNLGRRSAYERIAHLLCEIVFRSGNAETGSCRIPLTQLEMANTLGLSIVHVNRTLMRLRQAKLLTLEGGQLRVIDWPRFQAAAGFDASYLYR